MEISNLDDETDSTIIHFLEIFLHYSALVCMGLLFPLAFPLSFITIMMEVYIDKRNFFEILRRPSPNGEANLGPWEINMKIVSFIGVLTNAYILTEGYSSWFLGDKESEKILLLLAFIVGALILWSLLGSIFG